MAKAKKQAKKLTKNQYNEINEKLGTLKTHSLFARTNLLSQFGKQFNGDRDLFVSLGWAIDPSFDTYNGQYQRGNIAKTIVNIKPEDTWRGDITVSVPEGENGNLPPDAQKFEAQLHQIWKDLRLNEYFLRADKMAGIGQYSALRLGFKEPMDTIMKDPISDTSEILFVTAFSQVNADVTKIFDEPAEPRFGLPQHYQITETNDLAKPITGTRVPTRTIKQGESVVIHSDRIVHIAENLLEDEIYGTPRLECVLNNLYDLQKVSGGSAEMYWRGAFPGYNFELDPDAEIDSDDLAKVTKQIDDMIMGLKRYISTQGVTAESLAPQVSDPEKQVDVQIDQIAGATRIPKRVLLGSERGEMASTQDRQNWAKVIQSRREVDCERWIRDYTNKLIKQGILPKIDNYIVNWPSLFQEDQKERSEIGLNTARAMGEYILKGGDDLMPPEEFLVQILGVPTERVDEFKSMFENFNPGGEDDLDRLIAGMDADDPVRDAVANALKKTKKLKKKGATND